MKRNRIQGNIRIVLGICAIVLFAVNFVPIWQIDLDAPQYPEGLRLLIFANKLAGNVDIINGLNHYIGMKTLHTDDFIEFKILPYLIAFFSIAILATALTGNRRLLYTVLVVFILFGIVSMVDFWKWEYDYGHNLDPNAAIIVPGMAYQPPLIGFKQLLNFGAYSIPSIGGWIFVGVGVVLLLCSIREWRRQKKNTRSYKPAGSLAVVVLSFICLQSCNTGPQPIQAGIDQCSFCKMTVSDTRFACELITQKGKVYKFDDAHCMTAFVNAPGTDKSTIKQFYLADFNENTKWLNAEDAWLLKSESLKSPMGGNTAAFANEADQKAAGANYPGTPVLWKEIMP
jgi:copper chaperone NosL